MKLLTIYSSEQIFRKKNKYPKSSLLFKSYLFKKAHLLFFFCLVSQIMLAQIALNLTNDTRANDRYCDHDGQVFIGCGNTYTDDGGSGLYGADLIDIATSNSANNYGNDAYEPIFWTFCPSNPVEEKVRLTFTEFNIHTSDHFYVYDGDCSLANGDINPNIRESGQDDDRTLNFNDLIQIAGATTAQMSKVAGQGTALFGAGWVEASCNNISGCITIGWNPDGDGNKGTGWNFNSTCVSRGANLICPTTVDLNNPSNLLGYNGLTIGCSESITLPVPPAYLLGCANSGNVSEQVLASPYYIEVIVDGASLGFVGGNNLTYPEMNVGIGRHQVVYILYFDETGNGSNGPLKEVNRLVCSFTIFDSVDLVCISEVNISLGDDCASRFIPNDVVETECAPAYPLTLILRGRTYTSVCGTCDFRDRSNEVLLLDEGIHEYILRDDCNNACFGKINLRDIQGPQCLGPQVVGVLCTSEIEVAAPNFLDCNEIVDISYTERVLGACGVYSAEDVEQLELILQIVPVGTFTEISSGDFVLTGSGASIGNVSIRAGTTFESILVRNWRAEDSKGNFTEDCPQIIALIRPDTLYMPRTAILEVACGDDISPSALYELQNSDGTKRFSKAEIAPWYNDPVIGGAQNIEVILPESGANCHYATTYTDQVVQVIGNTKKIARTWSWLDWCDANPTRGGSFVQVIKIVDNEEPILLKGPEVMERSADLFECTGNITLEKSEWIDDCGAITSYRTEIRAIKSNGDIGVVLWENEENGGHFQDIELGCYYVLYYASDNNDNETSNFGTTTNPWAPEPINVAVTTLCVADDIQPQARCHDQVNISLRSTVDRIYASDIDAGSYDNCGIANLEVSFSEIASYAPFLEVDCKNLNQDLKIYLKVTDSNGNSNSCWGTITVIPNPNFDDCGPEISDNSNKLNIAGRIVNTDNEYLEDVTIKIYGTGGLQSSITDASGAFNFNLLKEGQYTIIPEKEGDLLNGVSTFDLVLISKHILGIRPFQSPYQYIAADVNKSGTITAFDILLLRQLVLNQTTDFAQNTSWRFIDSSHDFGSDVSTTLSQNFSEMVEVEGLSNDRNDINFFGVKIGDVNSNAIPNRLVGSETRSMVDTMLISIEDRQVRRGETVAVSFLARDSKTVQGYQFTMQFTDLEIVEILDGVAQAENFHATSRGTLSTSWHGELVQANNLTLFTVVFKVLNSGRLSELIHLNSEVVISEAYTASNELMDVAVEFTEKPALRGLKALLELELMQNVPNPAKEETLVGFNLSQSGMVELTIKDLNGKCVHQTKGLFPKGYNELIFNKDDFGAPGVFYYSVKALDTVVTKKMVFIE